MKYLVTGGAGFVGSHLVDRLLAGGHEVVVYDNLSTGMREFLATAAGRPGFRFEQGDLLDSARLVAALGGVDFVFHLAAHADLRRGPHDTGRDLEQNALATLRLLEAMRARGVRRIGFASSGAVYGEASVFPTPEHAPFPLQTSLYGASKLAAEGLISAFCEAFEMQAWIFRFVSILGERYSHGHVFDFCRALRAEPRRLRILGDGRQRKSYLYVGDCVEAVLLAVERAQERVNVLNLGADEYCEVRDSAAWISAELGLEPRFEYGGGTRGWVGDSPFIFLDCSRVRALGWKPSLSIREAVLCTVRYLAANPWLFAARDRVDAAGARAPAPSAAPGRPAPRADA